MKSDRGEVFFQMWSVSHQETRKLQSLFRVEPVSRIKNGKRGGRGGGGGRGGSLEYSIFLL